MAKKMNAKKRIKNQPIKQAPKIRGDKINGRRPTHSYARIEDDGIVHAYYSLGRSVAKRPNEKRINKKVKSKRLVGDLKNIRPSKKKIASSKTLDAVSKKLGW